MDSGEAGPGGSAPGAGAAASAHPGPFSREELKARRLAVLMGGLSSERDVSLRTGAAVMKALQAAGYDPVGIDVSATVARDLAREGVEVAFLAVHGRWGEDGALQGLLELLRIPYTGSGVLASALAMDKIFSKHVFAGEGLPTPPHEVVRVSPGARPAEPAFGFPCVVKPKAEGSSVGVSIVKGAETYTAALAEAARYGADVLVEKFIAGREVCVAVLDGVALGAIEVRPKREFYDYQAKYLSGDTEYLCPAPLDPPVMHAVLELGLRAHSVLGCSGASRSDILVDASGAPWILEVNTLPGMTATSLLPKIAAYSGIDFPSLCERLALGACLKS
jgi:D-alanine-D-alanine ligase